MTNLSAVAKTNGYGRSADRETNPVGCPRLSRFPFPPTPASNAFSLRRRSQPIDRLCKWPCVESKAGQLLGEAVQVERSEQCERVDLDGESKLHTVGKVTAQPGHGKPPLGSSR